MLVQLDDADEKVRERRGLYVQQDALDDIGLRLYERQHLSSSALRNHTTGRRGEGDIFTSAGFLLKNATFTLAK